jgi:hypothetical protein
VSSGGAPLCKQACATVMTCFNLRGCSSTLADKKRQQGAITCEKKTMNHTNIRTQVLKVYKLHVSQPQLLKGSNMSHYILLNVSGVGSWEY